jgi:hypothetical protein
MKRIASIFCILVITATFFLPSHIHAEGEGIFDDINQQTSEARKAAGFSAPDQTGSVQSIVGRLINVSLSLLGTIFVVLIVYAGYLWMTSGGDDTKVANAKKLLASSIIGLFIILTAYAITRMVIEATVETTTRSNSSSSSNKPWWQ